MANARAVLKARVKYAESASSCISRADVCIVATGWDEFRSLKPALFKRLMRTPAIVDGRRIFEPELFTEEGVQLLRVGTATGMVTSPAG
jgi:UDPglucose 6-dehydrogenase